jgi:hypothetical protein
LARSKLGFDDDDDGEEEAASMQRTRKLKSLEEMMADTNGPSDAGKEQTEGTVDRMDIDGPAGEDDDPLDAFMQDVSEEVSKLVHSVGKHEPSEMLEEEEGAVGEAVLKVDDDDEDGAGDEEEDILAWVATLLRLFAVSIDVPLFPGLRRRPSKAKRRTSSLSTTPP